ncbi:MAG: carbamoyltransferase N-terminal domain-containing protein, partial [Thiohalobacteraceae bacterium]
MRVLGISAYYHDSAAALVEDGRIRCAAQEERFTRKKHDASFPRNAVAFCLEEAGIGPNDIDHVAFYDKPFLKFERLLETYIGYAPRGFKSFKMAIPLWLREKLFQKDLLSVELARLYPGMDWTSRLLFSEHHLSHAASAFFPSPFEQAVVLTMDGVGEWATTSVALGSEDRLQIHKELHFPHSLGLLYSAFTYYTGFKVNSGEYKLMGLAPYGEPRFKDLILEKLLDLKPDGTFRLDMRYFNYCTGLTMTNARFDALFGAAARHPEEPVEQRHMDLAASIQAVTEEIVLRLTRALAREYRVPNLCLAGGVALNCVANGKILRDGAFESVWVQPAAGDAGGALGAAMVATHMLLGERRPELNARDSMTGSYLGPRFEPEDVERRLRAAGAKLETLPESDLVERTAQVLAEGKAVGWFQGRMEFGPRALGGRSILGDPRSPSMQRDLNLKIKFRESFRPFAPSVRVEDVGDWFELDKESPYMLMVADVKASRRRTMTDEEQRLSGIDKLNVPRSEIPAVTHVDYSARIQTVD